MATSVGDLAINVSTNSGRVETDFNRLSETISTAFEKVAKSIDQLNRGQNKIAETTAAVQKEVTRNAATIQDRFNAVGDAFKKIAGLTIAGFGAKQFADLITGTIHAQASLVELGNIAGITADKMSALIPAARLSGTSLETVAATSAKFSKNLIDVQTGTGKTAEAFRALGFNAADAARFLKDPAQGLLELGQHLNKFADDGNKTAAVIALLGKNGAQLLPFLKDLGQQSELVARVTTEQAEASKHLADQMVLIKLAGEQTRNEIVSGIVPALTSMATAFLVARDNGASFWRALLYAAKDPDTVIGSITTVSKRISELQQNLDDAKQKNVASPYIFGPGVRKDIEDTYKALEDAQTRLKILQQIRDQSIFSSLRGTFTGDLRDRLANNSAFPQIKPSVDFRDVASGVDQFISAMEAAEKAITDAQVALDDFGKTESEKTSPAMKELIALLGTAEFAKFTKLQQQRIIDARLEADALQHSLSALNQVKSATEAYDKLLGELSGQADGFTTDFAAKLLVLDNALDQGVISLEKYDEALGILVNFSFDQQAGKLQAEIAKINASYQDFIDHITESAKRTELEISLLGQAPETIARATAEFQRQADVQSEINRLTNDWAVAMSKGQVEQASAILAKLNDILDRQGDIVRSAGDIAEAHERSKKALDDNLNAIKEFESTTKDVFESLFDKGVNTFKKIGDAIKKYLIDLLYQLTLKPFIINIAASLTGVSQGAIANTLGGSGGNSLLSLLTGGGGGVSLGGQLAAGGYPNLGAFVNGVTHPLATLGTAFTDGAAAAGGFASIVGAAVPLIGLAIPLLGNLIGGLFNKEPSQVRGRFQVGGSGFEDNVSTASRFGALGFSDADTAQFSGEAAQVFNKIVAGALDAFEQRFSAEQSDRLAGILQKTDFGSFEGTFTTEDFIKQYGGQVLQQVVSAAFDVLDPALGSVARQFKGTADEVATFGNSLLAIYDATKGLGEDLRANIIGALSDATQATADKVAAFVGIFKAFGDGIEGLKPQLEALDPQGILAFVDALGGAQKAAEAFAFIGANFTTSADKLKAAQTALTTSFDALGIAVPQTHQAFLDLLSSFDLTTEGGRTLYASVSQLAPLFVQVAGTADQAAQALAEQIKSAQDFFDENFFSDAEKQAQQFAVAMQQVAAAESALGISIPTTVNGFRDLVLGIDRSTDAGEALYDALIVLAPAIFDLGRAAQTAAAQITSATNQIIVSVGGVIQEAKALAQAKLDAFANLANASTGDFGAKLSIQIGLIQDAIESADRSQFTSGTAFTSYVGALKSSGQLLADELARFTVLSVQYDAQRAEQLVALQDWYNEQFHIFGGDTAFNKNVAALDALKTIFDEKWAAIVNGATEAAASLDEFIRSIQDIANQTGGNAGQQARLELALSTAKLTQLQSAYLKALPGSALATALSADIAKLTAYNTSLATQVAHFTSYSQQYGVNIANQLVALEVEFESWKTSVAGNAEALAIVTEIFNDRFADIVNGIKDGVNDLSRLKQSIADYLKGLVIGDLSPLTPTQRLDQSQQAFVDELMKAQAGDVGALGDITKFADDYLAQARDFFSSSQAYTDIFASVTQQLAQLAGTSPTGLPTTDGVQAAAIDSHLPTGPLASQSDVQGQTAATNQLNDTLIAVFGASLQQQAEQSDEALALLQRILAVNQRATTTVK